MKEEEFQQWLGKLGEGLEKGDAEAVSMLFATDAEFHDAPFIAPRRGRAAIQAAFQEEIEQRRDSRFSFDIIRYAPRNGWAMWSNAFTRAGTNDPVRMEGILNAQFGGDGLCCNFRQWWHLMEPRQGDLMRDFDA